MHRRAHLIWTFLPVLPVALGFAVLAVINDGGITLLSDAIGADALFADNRDLRFVSALVIFAAVALFQVIGCAAVAVFAALKGAEATPAIRNRGLLVFAASLVLVVLISVVARQDGFAGALNMAYRSTCAVLVKAQVAPHIMPGGCTDPGLSHFAWFGLLPYLSGILAAAATSALVSTLSTRPLANWAALLDQAFRATAFVLVASTIAMMLFYQLPLSVTQAPAARTLISDYAQAMTLFWGVAFSLTLLAVFGPAHLMLSRALAAAAETDATLQKDIAAKTPFAQAKRILTTLAPLLVGSAASAIDLLSGALGV